GGGAFVLVGAVGLLRMPDLFTRMHAASISDAFGMSMIMLGLVLQAGPTLVAVKLLFLLVFLLFVGPVATHALARAAVHAGVRPLLAEAGDRAQTERLDAIRAGEPAPSKP